MKGLLDWLDERAGVRAMWEGFANEHIPGGARFRYVFGSILVFLFMQQVVLGILLAAYYSPSASQAWASTAYLNDTVTAGWFLRGLHHHGSSAMVVLTGLHFLQTALAGAYKRPRELNWLTGLAMGGLVLAFALTGYLLPWDQKGYWATQVATGIMGSLPGGEPQRVLLQGGAEYGNLTLTRFYALHVFVLPIGLAGLLAVHLTLFRRHGVTPPELPQAELDAKAQRFFPSQLLWDLIGMGITSVVLVLLTFSTHGAELFAPAQPASNFVARPEWYFLPLFQLLKYFEGPLQIIATVIIPGGLAAFLALLPWIDRAQSRKASERMPIVGALALIMTGVITLTSLAIVEDKHNAKFQKGLVAAHAEAERTRELAKTGVLPEGGEAVFYNDPVFKSRLLFKEHCQGCHTLGNEGGDNAPNLTNYKNREWLTSLIRNAQDKRFFGGTKGHRDMKPYAPKDLPDDQLKPLVEYLTSLIGDQGAKVDTALAKKGQEIFEGDIDCNNCHVTKPGESGDAPNFAGHGSKAWIERVIRDSSAPDLFGKAAEMPKFGKKLTDEQIRQLAELIASQRTSGGEG